MSNHTPGPWNVSRKKLGTIEHTDPSGLVDTVAFTSGDTSGSPSANARLIAAAPDLLAACEVVWDSCDAEGRIMLPANGKTITELRSAIAKAKGEPTR